MTVSHDSSSCSCEIVDHYNGAMAATCCGDHVVEPSSLEEASSCSSSSFSDSSPSFMAMSMDREHQHGSSTSSIERHSQFPRSYNTRRRRWNTASSLVVVAMATTVTVGRSGRIMTTTEAFAPPAVTARRAWSPSSDFGFGIGFGLEGTTDTMTTTTTSLSATMKRSGNHDLSSGNAPKARAARTKSKTAAAMMASATAVPPAPPAKSKAKASVQQQQQQQQQTKVTKVVPKKSPAKTRRSTAVVSDAIDASTAENNNNSNNNSSNQRSIAGMTAEMILANAKQKSTPTTANTPASPNSIARAKRSNVFEQFSSSKYITSSPYDVEFEPSAQDLDFRAQSEERERNGSKRLRKSGVVMEEDDEPVSSKKKNTASNSNNNNNNNSIRKSNKINLRLQSLLHDDTGEQEMELYKDDSPEAAEQLADFRTYSKMSEEARRKANAAVSVAGVLEEDLEMDHGESGDEVDSVNGGDGIVGLEGGKKTSSSSLKKKIMVNGVTTTNGANNYHHHHDGRVTLDSPKINSAITANPADGSTLSSSMPSSTIRKRRVRATVKETGSDSMAGYIKSLGQHELLYKEDEILLGKQVRILTLLEEKRRELEEDLLRPPTYAQWAKATNHTVPSLKQQIRRSQRAKAALIEANLRLVITVARQAVKKSPFRQSKQTASSIQFQDACQQGIIGLTRATEKFDPDLGFRFSTYAIWWIQKEVAKNVSEQSRTVRLPPNAIKKINDIRIHERVLMNELGRRPRDEELAEKCGMTVEKLNFYRSSAKEVGSLDKKLEARTGKGSSSTGGTSGGETMEKFVKDTEQPSPAELVDQQMMKEDIRRLVKTLSPREQAVIRLRFGLDDGKPQTLGDIGAKFGVEKERIKKIEARALLKLRQPSRSQVVKCYVSDHT